MVITVRPTGAKAVDLAEWARTVKPFIAAAGMLAIGVIAAATVDWIIAALFLIPAVITALAAAERTVRL